MPHQLSRRPQGRPSREAMAELIRGRRGLARRDLPAAAGCFTRALARDPRCAAGYLNRAAVFLLQGDADGAAKDLSALSALDLSALTAYRDLTTPTAAEFPELLKVLEVFLQRRPCSWGHVLRAFALRGLLRYDEALSEVDRALALEPGSAALWALRSRLKLANTQEGYDGVVDLERALRLAPRWAWLHCWLGEALRHRGEYAPALKALNYGLALDDRYQSGYAWRGAVLAARGYWRPALADLTRALRWNPVLFAEPEPTADQKSWILNQRMLVWRALRDVPRALRDLGRAHAYNNRYEWLFNPSRSAAALDAALAELDGFLKRRPRTAAAVVWRARTLQRAGRHEEAREGYDRVIRLSPRLAWAWSWKGALLAQRGELEEAESLLTRALELDARYGPSWGERGRVRRESGDWNAAVNDYSRAIRLDPRCAWAYAGRGRCHARLGNAAEALTDLKHALRICPQYPEASAWQSELLQSASGRATLENNPAR